MTRDESLALLGERWPAIERVMAEAGAKVASDLWRDELFVYARLFGKRQDGSRDPYVFRLDCTDFDEHGPRVELCDPDHPEVVGSGMNFYPRLEGNSAFAHAGFLCMPGERRCYESQHPEWKKREYFAPESIIDSLFTLLNSPAYRGRA